MKVVIIKNSRGSKSWQSHNNFCGPKELQPKYKLSGHIASPRIVFVPSGVYAVFSTTACCESAILLFRRMISI